MPNFEEQRWDLSINTLQQLLLELDEDNPDKQNLLEQLSQNVQRLTLQPIVPSEQTTYLVW